MAVPNMGVPTLAALVPPGATRFLDFTFPAFLTARTTGAFPATTGQSRLSGNSVAGAVSQTSGGTGTQGLVKYNNQASCTLVNAAGPDLSAVTWALPIVYPFLDRLGGGADFNSVYDLVVWRCQFIMAFPNIPGSIPAGADIGMLMCAANQTNLNGTRGGVLFGPRDNNTIGLGVRRVNGGGYTVDTTMSLAAAGIADLTNFNLYELRLLNATPTRNALLKAFINGVQFGGAIDCGTSAALFPAIDVGGGGFTGFKFGVAIQALGFAYTMHFAQTNMIIAQTED